MDNKTFKYLSLFLTLNIAFQLISDVTAGKIISLFDLGVSVTVLYFPFTYIISDIITEVYGYSKSRQILWYTLIASILAGIFYQIAVFAPAAPFFENSDAYNIVFGIVPLVLVGGWIAVFTGDIANNYILAKMKIWTSGRYLWLRTISSTIVGQGVNTAVFYLIALSSILPGSALIEGILAGWAIKTLVEILMTPITYLIINKIKKAENVDYYDRTTNFNPFIFKD